MPIGVTLLVLSIAVGVISSALTIPKFADSVSREVIISGQTNPVVPGRLTFRVASASGDSDEPLTVGVAIDSDLLPQPSCALQTSEGDEVGLKAPSRDAILFRGNSDEFLVVGIADLGPGSYVAICGEEGDSAQNNGRFTVGHAFDSRNLSEFTPFFWFLGAVGAAGIMFVVGVVTLTVGLIRRSRARKKQAAWGSGGYQGGPGGYPPGPGAPYAPGGGPYPGGPGGPPGPGSGYPGAPGSGYPPPPTSGYPPPPASPPTPSPPGPGSPAPSSPGPGSGPGHPAEPGSGPGYPAQPGSGHPPGQTPPGQTTPGTTHPEPGQAGGEPEYPWRAPAVQPDPSDSTDRPTPPSGWTIPPSKR